LQSTPTGTRGRRRVHCRTYRYERLSNHDSWPGAKYACAMIDASCNSTKAALRGARARLLEVCAPGGLTERRGPKGAAIRRKLERRAVARAAVRIVRTRRSQIQASASIAEGACFQSSADCSPTITRSTASSGAATPTAYSRAATCRYPLGRASIRRRQRGSAGRVGRAGASWRSKGPGERRHRDDRPAYGAPIPSIPTEIIAVSDKFRR
jgi:hypothetical protein